MKAVTTKEFFAMIPSATSLEILSDRDFWKRVPEVNRILDVGCGLGEDIMRLREKYPNAEVVGVDRQPEMLGFFPEAIRADATNLPFETGYFDIAFANCVLCENENPEEILKEMRRVAKLILICDVDRKGNFTYASYY